MNATSNDTFFCWSYAMINKNRVRGTNCCSHHSNKCGPIPGLASLGREHEPAGVSGVSPQADLKNDGDEYESYGSGGLLTRPTHPS